MSIIEKGNKIVELTSGLPKNQYVIFEDNFITQYDKSLKDENGVIYNVFDFKEVERISQFLKKGNDNGTIKVVPIYKNCTCVKLDKKINIGDVLFVNR